MSAERIEIEAVGPAGAELARYRISSGERVLMGWHLSGGIEVTDRPVEGRCRAFLVDRGFRCPEQLAAFLGEYVEHARRLDACPMSAETIAATLALSETDQLARLLGEAG